MIRRWEELENRELLSHGVTWVDRAPFLRVVDVAALATYRLPISRQSIGFRIKSETEYCIGHYAIDDAGVMTLEVCPTQELATTTGQCARCAAIDVFRFAHHAHLGGYTPGNLDRYMSQPHWLYLATFADGTTKVGTASEIRKTARVDEQGASVVSYVARAQDGLRIRTMEDSVTDRLGLTQRVSRGVKLRALAKPLPMDELQEIHDKLLAQVATSFGAAAAPEPWIPPGDYGAVMIAGDRDVYEASMRSGEHGFFAEGCAGPFVLAQLRSDSSVRVVADLNETKGLRLEIGEFQSEAQAVQAAFF